MAVSKSSQPIRTLEDWQRLAPPKSASHWKPGRSAQELARAWLDGDNLPAEVSALFRAHPDFGSITHWSAVPEAKLRFDDFRGEPRNSDLVVDAEDAHGRFLIAVEGKADEPFGDTVENTRTACKKRQVSNPSSNGAARVAGLVEWLLNQQQSEAAHVGALRYQLLTATAGTIREAERRNYDRAVLLIHEFVTSETTPRNVSRNAADLNRFASALFGGPAVIDAGQLLGPLGGLGARASRVRFYIGKASRKA